MMAPPPVAWRKAPIEAGRLYEAIRLKVKAHAPGVYWVESRSDHLGHWVALDDPDAPPCDCGDHGFRDMACAHMIAVLLHEEDQRALAAVGQLIMAAARDRRLVLAVSNQRLPQREPKRNGQ